jgi:hypothetical protein
MRRTVPPMNDAYLGDKLCEPAADPAAKAVGRVASSKAEVLSSSGFESLSGRIPAMSSALALKITGREFRCAALIGAIVLGLVTITRALAASHEMVGQNAPVQAAAALRIEPGSPTGDLHSGCRAAHRWHKLFHKIHKGISPSDASDDGTSRDPDDDNDTSDDLNCDDDTDGPILTSLSGGALYFIAAQNPSTPSLTGSCSPLFLTLQRLRC